MRHYSKLRKLKQIVEIEGNVVKV